MVFRYDVYFFCQDNGDFRKTFLKSLHSRQINVFDDTAPYQGGHGVIPQIRESKVLVFVFTADLSGRLLSRLRKMEAIINNWEKNEQVLVPVFLNAEPCDLLTDEMLGKVASYYHHLVNRSMNKKKEYVDRWRDAVTAMAALPSRILARDEDVTVWKRLNVNPILKYIVKSKRWWQFSLLTFLAVINLLLETVSAVSDQLSSVRKPYFARISVLMSILAIVLSITELTYKIQVHKVHFRCKWPIPWFYYPSRGYKTIFRISFLETVLLFCGVGQLVVSTTNCILIKQYPGGVIKISVWPLVFAIGMVIIKFRGKPVISKEN